MGRQAPAGGISQANTQTRYLADCSPVARKATVLLKELPRCLGVMLNVLKEQT